MQPRDLEDVEVDEDMELDDELCRDIQMKLPDCLWQLDYVGRYAAGKFNEDFASLDSGAPLFLLVALGWGSVKIGLFTNEVTKALGHFTFRLLMPVMLFKLMSGFADMPPVDWRILIAFFLSLIHISEPTRH